MSRIENNELNELFNGSDKTDSFKIADFYGCKHFDILRTIQRLDVSADFLENNFEKAMTESNYGKKYPYYIVTKRGFALLTAVFRGSRAGRLKEQFINDYYAMQQRLRGIDSAKTWSGRLRAVMRLVFKGIKSKTVNREIADINRLVLGMSSKQFRTKNGLTEQDDITPCLSDFQREAFEKLYQADILLCFAVSEYKERKAKIEEIYKQFCADCGETPAEDVAETVVQDEAENAVEDGE